MQPGVTVALATVWLAGAAGVLSATLYPSFPSHDQYSPQLPQKHHEVTQGPQGHANWNLQEPSEDLLTPKIDQIINVHLPIEMSNLKPPRGMFLHYGSPDRSYGIGLGQVDSNLSSEDGIGVETQPENPRVVQKKISDTKESARQRDLLIAQQKKAAFQREDSDDYDSFQDQGPGSIEVYRLDLFEEDSLFDRNPTKKKVEAIKESNKFEENELGENKKEDNQKKDTKNKKNESKQNENKQENELKTNQSMEIIPSLHDLTIKFKSEKDVLIPQPNFSNQLEEDSGNESFGVGGVPELQVGCEGVEAGIRDKRSSSGDNTDNTQDEKLFSHPGNIVDIQLVYESGEDEDPQGIFYEEMDELIKLKKLEEELRNPPPPRGDIPIHLHEEYDKNDKVPVRGDLASAFLNDKWDELVQRKESPDSKGETYLSNGRKLLSISQPSVLRRKKRDTGGNMWGFGEDEGVMPDDAMQSDEKRMEEEKKREEAWRRAKHMRIRQEEDRRHNSHRQDNHHHQGTEDRRRREERERIEEEHSRRLKERENENMKRDEERRRMRHEEKRRMQEEHTRMLEYRKKWPGENRRQEEDRVREEERRRSDEERRRQDYESRRLGEMKRPKEIIRPEEMRRHEDSRRTEKERRRQEEEKRKHSDRRRQEEVRRRYENQKRVDDNEQKLKAYIQSNTPIVVGSRRSSDDLRRRALEERRMNPPENLMRSRHLHDNRHHSREPVWLEQKRASESVRPNHRPSPPNDMGWENRMDKIRRPDARNMEEEAERLDRERILKEGEEKRRAHRRRMEQEARRLEEEDRRRKSQRYEEDRLWHERMRQHAERMRQEWMHEANRRSQADRKPVWSRYQPRSNEKGYLPPDPNNKGYQPPPPPPDLNNKGYQPPPPPPDLNNKGYQPPPPPLDPNNKGYQPPPPSDPNNKGYQPPPPPLDLNNKGYQPPPPLPDLNNKGYQPPPPPLDLNNKGYQPPPDLNNKGYQPPPPDLNNKGYQPPPPDLNNKGYQPPPPDLNNKGYQPLRGHPQIARDRQRLEQERRRIEAERLARNRGRDDRYQELQRRQDTLKSLKELRRRQEETERLNALPVSATIIVRPGGSGTNSSSPLGLSRGGFGSEIDFPGISSNHRGIQAARSSAPATRRPPVKGPAPCIWAVAQCCPATDRVVSCFESLGCPGVNWDPKPCNPTVIQAAKYEIAKFHSSSNH